jgi:hypothetical protein
MSRYILAADGRTPTPCDDLFAWEEWYRTADRTLQRTFVVEGSNMSTEAIDTIHRLDGLCFEVSTVFLSLDHNFGGGPPPSASARLAESVPILWETMVFSSNSDDELNDEQWRYSSYDDALEGHLNAVELVIAHVTKITNNPAVARDTHKVHPRHPQPHLLPPYETYLDRTR